MDAQEARWESMIRGLRGGDDDVTRDFCEQYGAALERVADRNLQTRLRRRFDPEDVVQSAFRTFLRRASGGQFQLPDSESLWRLLCSITLNKVREQARLQLRQKRTPKREVRLKAGADSVGVTPKAPGPAPEEIAEFAEQFEQLMGSLNEEERRVVDLKLEDCTQAEVAERLGTSERTVRRILKRIETRFLDL